MPSRTEVERVGREVRRNRRRVKRNSLISNELIIDALERFLAENFASGGGKVLDLGAGTAPFAPLYDVYFEESVTVDVDHSPHELDVDLLADAAALPFADGEFDAVLATEVLEHCPDPQAVLNEIRRILRPGGAVLITTPFMKGLHEMPYDFYRYTPPALTMLCERAGLRVERIEPRGNRVAMALGSFQYPVSKVLQRLDTMTGRFGYGNPLFKLLIAWPQLTYLALWRRFTRFASPAPLGYATYLKG
jgi:SAM-dependent methyltransferase